MAGYELSEMYKVAWGNKKPRESMKVVRDKLRLGKKKKVIYDVWGNTIAVLNPKTNTLAVSSAGWRTKLTKDRLNKILRGTGTQIRQKKGEWFMKTPSGKEVEFKGTAKFKIKRGMVM